MEQLKTDVKDPAEKPDNSIGNNPVRLLYINYETILNAYHFSYDKNGIYLIVKGDQPRFPWTLYISVIRPQLSSLLNKILPFLQNQGLAFAIPENSNIHNEILDGSFGYNLIGKIIEVYVLNADELNAAAHYLMGLTDGFSGPAIPNAFHLGNCLYADTSEFSELKNMTAKGNQIRAAWPFKNFKYKRHKDITWLNRKYLLAKLLKSDAKGNVYKGLNTNSWTNVKYCIIKQGKNHQCHDDAGRDIKQRLRWQYEAQSDLYSLVPVPKPIEYLEKKGDAYFIMEYIEGKSYHDYISEIQRGRLWEDIEMEEQILLIQILIQAVRLVELLHDQGYIHRDLSPENFIVNREGKLYAIDIELCFNYLINKPDPFYTLGTEGYMSIEQARCTYPKIEDDIYGLGALLVRTITGISPTKFATADIEKLDHNLAFFIRNLRLRSIICSCLQSDHQQRPSTSSIKHNLELYHSLLVTNNHDPEKERLQTCLLKEKIEQSLKSVWSPLQFVRNYSWMSKTIDNDPQISNQAKNVSWYPGLYNGTAGILYVLAVADQAGYDLGNNRDRFYENFTTVKEFFEQSDGSENAGLFNGSAGFAVLTALMINQGQLEGTIQNADFISNLLSCEIPLINLSDGICGQGLAMMICSQLLDFPHFSKRIGHIALKLIDEQNKDGSWNIKQNPNEQKGIKINSLFHGIAGITYFLMLYGENHYSEQSKSTALKALGWLLKQRKNIDGQFLWSVNTQNETIDPWLEYGFSGIAYLFMKAYELYNDSQYRDAAISALLAHPVKITSNYFSQSNGLAGLGEIYLEAYRIFKEKSWLDRALHIADFFLNTGRETDQCDIYWLEGSDEKPYPDLMKGNCGIIHFLLRCQQPSKIKFPVLSL